LLAARHHVDDQYLFRRRGLPGWGRLRLGCGGGGDGFGLTLFAHGTFALGLRGGSRHRYRLVEIQPYLLGLMRRARLGFLQTRIEVAKGRLLPLGAPYHTDRAEQLVMLAAVRQVLEIAFQLEPYARAAAHAPPAIKKYARNHQKANNDQPFTQTKIHEYRVPVCYALARVRQYHGCMALCTGRFYTSASAAASS